MESQVEAIIGSAGNAFEVTRVPKKYKQNFLLTLRSFLQKSGANEDVCHHCLGTGKFQRGKEEVRK